MPDSLNILYLTHRVPYPPDKGDRIRTFHTLRHLASNHRVFLACLADEPVLDETRTVLKDLCEKVAIIPVQSLFRKLRMGWAILTGGIASVSAFQSSSLKLLLEQWGKSTRFDIALTSASSMAPYLKLPALQQVPAIVDLVDVDSEKWISYASSASFPRNWVYQREGKALRNYEQDLATWANAVLLVSDAEAKLFETIAPQAPIHTITNGVDLDYYQPSPTQPVKPSCVFVGAMDYHPNVDAVCWFAAEVWPQVLQRIPQATFKIVGRKPTPAVQALARLPGIEVAGQVPDVRPYVHDAAVVVAPLRIARGLQNKVLEAMALAKPVVASPPALAGLFLDQPSPAVCVNSIDEWITALCDLFVNPERCKQLAVQGRQYVESRYEWSKCLEPLSQLLDEQILPRTPITSKLPPAVMVS